MLSKVSDQIGSVLADGVVNYVRNVVDVNTCRIPQLVEQARMLSYNLDSLSDLYSNLPGRMQLLVDLFSINQEWLIGNGKNHILSDQTIREILGYLREHGGLTGLGSGLSTVDALMQDPHGLLDDRVYWNFVQRLFHQTVVDALTTGYSEESAEPVAFNVFHQEMDDPNGVMLQLESYRSWVDRYLQSEVEHPWNCEGVQGGVWEVVQQNMAQKRISSKFDPFKVADWVYFHGLNPDHQLSQDELDLVDLCVDYHSRTKYDYRRESFSSDQSTRYAYYRELEFVQWVGMVLTLDNCRQSLGLSNLSYETSMNRFSSAGSDGHSTKAMQIFLQDGCLVRNAQGEVALNQGLLISVAGFLRDFARHVQEVRENVKTIAQKHAMRGTGALVVHLVNDYLQKELPAIRDSVVGDSGSLPLGWEEQTRYANHGNVQLLEYEDDNEYFNIEPTADVVGSDSLNSRYWEQLEGLADDDSLGVLTKGQIADFYRNVLGMGRLQPKRPSDYDDVCDFLVDLFRTGANPIALDESGEIQNPIDDVLSRTESEFGYTRAERVAVQGNQGLRKAQETQFRTYSGNYDLASQGIFDLASGADTSLYWKNSTYSSQVLHPFMYNLKLWDKLTNIVVNGYRDYADSKLIGLLSSQATFDDLFGDFGEGQNFWKYNILDLSGYTTRYEAAVKNEYLDDGSDGRNPTVSPLTGYDGLFHPEAVREWYAAYSMASHSTSGHRFALPPDLLVDEESYLRAMARLAETPVANLPDWDADTSDFHIHDHFTQWSNDPDKFIYDILSIYWQYAEEDTFYRRWYSHLNYTRAEYQRIALQLWYWRDRVAEVCRGNCPIARYVLDAQGNSIVLVQTLSDQDAERNPYLVDLKVAQDEVEEKVDGNRNLHVPSCVNSLRMPSELWIRWKSNPIGLPAFDVMYDQETGDEWFDQRNRSESAKVEMGQVLHTNSTCNDAFRRVVDDWRGRYSRTIPDNRLPVFFDMEQSGRMLALAAWSCTRWDTGRVDLTTNRPIYWTNTGLNPIHILSNEKFSSNPSEWQLEEYGSNSEVNSAVWRDDGTGFLFDAYHYCQADGSILIPSYRMDCHEAGSTSQESQVLTVQMTLVPAQVVKSPNYVASSAVRILNPVSIDLNQQVAMEVQGLSSGESLAKDYRQPRFGHEVRVARSSRVAFSPWESNGQNRVRLAFLGCLAGDLDRAAYQVSSCDAMTRYELDSQSPAELALVGNARHEANGTELKWTDGQGRTQELTLAQIDPDVANSFNSYDSLDKYVLVVDLDTPVDSKPLFDLAAPKAIRCSICNVLSDAGWIPHFAFQSSMPYGDEHPEGGIAKVWENPHLGGKDHWSFQLLGLDDRRLAQAYDAMQRMVVDDLTDDCRTMLAPARLMEGIYRIWCDAETRNGLHFQSEFSRAANPEFTYASGQTEWIWDVDSQEDWLEVADDGWPLEFRLENYYIQVLRAEDGEVQNERRYILPATKASELAYGPKGVDGWVDCQLDPWDTSLAKDDQLTPDQVLLVGTPNPFDFDADGERKLTHAESLQRGNGVCGVSSIQVKVQVERVQEANGRTKAMIHPMVRFVRQEAPSEGDGLATRISARSRTIPAGQVVVMLSHRDIDTLGKYHMLNRFSNLYLMGSLPDGGNQFMGDDFVSSESLELEQVDGTHWRSTDGSLEFSSSDVKGSAVTVDEGDGWTSSPRTMYNRPPWYLEVDGKVWYLEQDPNWVKEQMDSPSTRSHDLSFIVPESKSTPLTAEQVRRIISKTGPEVCGEEDEPSVCGDPVNNPDPTVCLPSHVREIPGLDDTDPDALDEDDEDGDGKLDHRWEWVDDQHTQTAIRPMVGKGGFVKAHLQGQHGQATSYLDYLYVRRAGLGFKVNEESSSLFDSMNSIPPFQVDEATKNKLADLNDVQAMRQASTFIHQTEDPQTVEDCPSMNPLHLDVHLDQGVETTDPLGPDDSSESTLVCLEGGDFQGHAIQLDTIDQATRVSLQLEDGEIDDLLKVYVCYHRVEDPDGQFHFDLYFNPQNLLNSPFEYISTITNQPNVLIVPDSHLRLSGDRFTDQGMVDEDKVRQLTEGGTLSLYAQAKTYSAGVLRDVKLIRLFQYRVWNVSDDRPRFLIRRVYSLASDSNVESIVNQVNLEFQDVLCTVFDDWLERGEDGNPTGRLKRDLVVA